MDSKIFLKYFPPFVCVIIIFFISIILYNIISPNEKEEDNRGEAESHLVPDSTRYVSLPEINTRIRYLSDIILQRQATNAQLRMTRGSERLQTRLSFIALFAVLLFPFLKSNKLERFVIVIATFFFFLFFYFFDIHTAYLDSLLENKNSCYNLTIIDLSNINQNDSIWYDLSYVKQQDWMKSKHAHSYSKKLCSFFRPDFSQITFYFIPFTVILVLYLILTSPLVIFGYDILKKK